MSESSSRVSPSQVALILERAAELEVQGDYLTVGELRRVAAEAGFDETLTEVAIGEILAREESSTVVAAATEEPGVPVKASRSVSAGRILTGAAIGAALGLTLELPEPVGIAAAVGAVAYLIRRALQGMKRGGQLDFQLQNLAVWLGTAIMAASLYPDVELLFVSVMILWIVLAVAGGLIARFGPRDPAPTLPPDPSPTLPPAPSTDRSGGNAGGEPTTRSA